MFTKETLVERFEFPFSDQAVGALNFADEEARGFCHNYIGTEHLLLGLMRSGITPALGELGIDLVKFRSATEFIIRRGDGAVEADIDFDPRAKTVIKLSIDEARRLHDRYLARDHVWLGLIREREGIAIRLLESAGVDQNRLRSIVLRTHQIRKVIVNEALDTLERMQVFFENPSESSVRKQQVKMVLDGILELISPQVKQ